MIWIVWPIALGIGVFGWWAARRIDAVESWFVALSREEADRRIEALERIYKNR